MKEMKFKKFFFLLGMVLLALVVCVILWLVAIIGSMNLSTGCLYRYNVNSQGNLANSDAGTNTVTLKASGNYTAVSAAGGGLTLDPSGYGQWLNTGLRITSGQEVGVSVVGEISLCKAYIPINNLQQDSNLDVTGNRIEIPRVEDKSTPPVSLILDARNPNWRNLTELYRNDKFYAALYSEKKATVSATSVYDYFAKKMRTADCREGKRTYSPICGRYSLWNGGSNYVSSCRLNLTCFLCDSHNVCPSSIAISGWCLGGWKTEQVWCSCMENAYSPAPEPYKNDGSFTYASAWTGNIPALLSVVSHDCKSESSYIKGEFQHEKYFWFSADNATGLITRIDNNVNPTNPAVAGSNYKAAQIETDQSFYDNTSEYSIINQGTYQDSDVGYLQYKLADQDGSYADNTGGYVLNIKQTKCARANGNAMNDSIEGRGALQYVIADYGINPNETTPTEIDTIVVNADGDGNIVGPSGNGGYLWLKIHNAPEDYKDSFGQYTVSLSSSVAHGSFFDDVLNPFFEGLKGRIKAASITVFKNMTCYQGIGGAGNCANFFNYIRGMLIIYIMLYGMMFLLGMARITQTDLVVRAVKVAFVAGLMNDKTFAFFNGYVFDFVTGFSDSIIANMSGYSLFSGSTSVSNPFMFMNEVFTKIFLSGTFAAQIMALLSMGINGVLYFILIFVCIGIVIIVGFRALTVYIMAYLAIAILIGIAPLFLTFILFSKTRYLFDNWVKFTFRYMIEPTVMLAGIIVLTQLFTIYLDYVVGYSVCWKCGIPFKIPFPSLPGFNPAFLDVPLFCFNWFAPWGFDYRSSSMGMNMQNMIVLLMLAYCMLGYIEYSSKIVSRIAGGVGGPSATGMGADMSGAIEEKGMSKVGMDKETRNQIKGAAAQRLKSTEKGKKDEPGKKGEQPDMPVKGGAKSSKGNENKNNSS